jgi:hypothetical protein
VPLLLNKVAPYPLPCLGSTLMSWSPFFTSISRTAMGSTVEGCLLHQVLISIMLFVDDVVLIASSPEGLQRQLDALALFCNLQQLTINLGKTKVMIFNGLKKTSNLHFSLKERRSRSPAPTHTWGCNSQDPASICNRHSSLESTRATKP